MTAIYDPSTRQWVNPPGHQGPLTGGLLRSGNITLRAPNSQETVSGNMANLLGENSVYMQINRKQAEAGAARRGLLNSTLASQAGQQAAIAGAMPIAQADAQIRSQASAQNAEALNAAAIADMQRAAASATGGATIGMFGNQIDADTEFERREAIMRLQSELNISEAEAGRVFEREMTLGDRQWRSGESELDRGLSRENWMQQAQEADRQRGFQRDQAQLDRDFERENRAWLGQQTERRDRMQMFSGAMGQIMSTLFSSPEYFRDPTAAQGFMEFFSTQFGSIFDRFFGASPNPTGG